MANLEKYWESLKAFDWCYMREIADKTEGINPESCVWLEDGSSCLECARYVVDWLTKEPVTDWTKVAVDTPIYVKDSVEGDWVPRHFSDYTAGKVYAFSAGATSFTSDHTESWNFAKLASDGQ